MNTKQHAYSFYPCSLILVVTDEAGLFEEFIEAQAINRFTCGLSPRNRKVDMSSLSVLVLSFAGFSGTTITQSSSLRAKAWQRSSGVRGNIMVSLKDGKLKNAKIIDLGLAKGVAEENSLSTVGAFVGTPAYASPEQFAQQGLRSIPYAS